MQDSYGQTEITAVGVKTQSFVRFDGIETLVLQGVGSQFCHQPDATTLLILVDHQTRSLVSNGRHCEFQLASAITAQRSEHFAGEALRMNAQQRYSVLQIAKRHHQGSFTFSFGHICSFKADQVEDAKNRRQVSGGHPTDAVMLCTLIHAVSVSRNRSSHISVGAISSPSPLQPNCSASIRKCMTWLISSEEGSLLPPVTECHAFDSGCRIRLPMSARSLSAVPAAALSPRRFAEPVGVATGLLPHTSGRQVMTSVDTAGSQVSESEISATLVSLRERFEAVRRDAIQRVRGRLGNLSADQENAIDSLSHAIIEKVLQAPMAMLKNASAGNQAVFVLETVRRIFNLRT